jgi:hypothetical protein
MSSCPFPHRLAASDDVIRSPDGPHARCHTTVNAAARAAPIERVLDSRYVRMINSGNRGLAALFSGDTDTASEAFREELTLCRDMVVRDAAAREGGALSFEDAIAYALEESRA